MLYTRRIRHMTGSRGNLRKTTHRTLGCGWVVAVAGKGNSKKFRAILNYKWRIQVFLRDISIGHTGWTIV